MIVTCAVLLLAGAWHASPARADGDPASDVLAGQALFLPQDAGYPPARQAQLEALLAAARRGGLALRVAVIAGAADLGSVTELWRQPLSYARFLGQELSLVYRGTLLVVMPDGFGVTRAGRPVAALQRAVTGIRVPGPGGPLAAAILTGVLRVATAAGHALAPPRLGTGTGPSRVSIDWAAWIAFGVGLALIALAWAASLRALAPGTRARAAGDRA